MNRFQILRHAWLVVCCGLLPALSAPPPLFAQTASTQINVAVRVDPRIELMTIVQLLSGYELLTKVESHYRREVEQHFAPFKEHRAVKLFAEMSKARFRYDAVPKAILAYSDPPKLSLRVEPPVDAIRSAGGKQKLEEFIRAQREFSEQSRFGEFFATKKETYDHALTGLQSDVEGAVAELHAYSGVELKGCTLVAGLLIHNGGFQATLSSKENAEVYSVIGAFGAKDGIPVFSIGGSIRYLVHHEFSHSYINPLVEKFDGEVRKSTALFEPIKEAMQRQAYNNWPTAVNEHIVRAITIRLAFSRSHLA